MDSINGLISIIALRSHQQNANYTKVRERVPDGTQVQLDREATVAKYATAQTLFALLYSIPHHLLHLHHLLHPIAFLGLYLSHRLFLISVHHPHCTSLFSEPFPRCLRRHFQKII